MSPEKIILLDTYCKYATTSSEGTIPEIYTAQSHITINANHTKTDESVHAFKSCNLNLSIVNDVMKQMDIKGWGHRYTAYIEEHGNLDLVSHE